MIRFFDFIFSLLGLIMLSPIFLVIAITIKLTSKGPVFYRQKRIGLNGKEFLLYKFRSMYIDADKKGLLITVGGRDPRITNVGYFIRKYKVDELPQLWNVLIGDMSLVGPRPEVKKYVDLYTAEQRDVLSVKPGITDWASILYKDENTLLENQPDPEAFYIKVVMPQKIRLNKIYIKEQSVSRYLFVLWTTVARIVGSRKERGN
jgi:lipopolysaccharide/colanic/teichoic acid biosynthesis glycosyltransferase